MWFQEEVLPRHTDTHMMDPVMESSANAPSDPTSNESEPALDEGETSLMDEDTTDASVQMPSADASAQMPPADASLDLVEKSETEVHESLIDADTALKKHEEELQQMKEQHLQELENVKVSIKVGLGLFQ